MATIASLLVNIGVRLDGALKVEQKIRRMKQDTRRLGDAGERGAGRFRRAFNRLRVTVERVGRRVEARVRSMVSAMGGLPGVAAAGTAALGGLAVGTFKFVDAQTAALDKQNKLSASLGVGVEELQRLQFAASQSGLGADQLSKGITKLNKNLLDIKGGAGAEARRALDSLGLTVKQLEQLSKTEQIGLIGDKLSEIPNKAERAATAAQIFGMRAGPAMATLLAEGSEGIAKLAADARGVFSQEDANRATEFQDRLGEVRNQVKGLVMGLSLELLPAVRDAVVAFRDWIRENDVLLQQAVPGFLRAVANAASDTATAITTLIDPLRTVVGLFDVFDISAGRAGSALASFAAGLARSMLPLQQTAQTINAVTKSLMLLGVVSGDKAATAIADSPALKRMQAAVDTAIANVPVRIGTTTVDRAGRPAARARGGGRGGGAGRAAKAGTPAKATTSGVTVGDAVQALLGGNAAVLTERLKGMAASTPSTRDVKPTVAIDFFNFDVKQTITTADPIKAGQESAAAIRKEFRRATARAGQALAGSVVR